MKSKYLIGMAVPLAALVAAVTLQGCNKSKTVKPEKKAITEAVYASGFVVPKDEYKVYALADGYITDKFREAGEQVKKGDALFHVQNDASAARAGASYSAYDLAKSNAGENSAVLTDLKNRIKSAAAKLQNDSLNYMRYKNMLAAGAVTKAQYDQAALAYEVSGNDLQSANENYRQRREQLQVELKNAESNLASSSNDLSNYVIKSMMAGMVYETYKELGEAVRRNELVALIGDKDHKLLQLSVDQQDIDKIKLGQQVVVKLDVTGEKVYKASISKIYPNMNQSDQTFKVDAEFNEAYTLDFIHASVEANIVIATRENALVIPRAAIQGNNQVQVKGLGGNKTVTIKPGIGNLEFVEVLEGVTTADEVVMPKEK